mmetsp:Transcript_43097/g.115213  ORF Transcript_43097/g.115213 Transcript_43097/m.115213 type:complete len:302 (-) Transcript_43097:1143-2048(-)
MAARRRVRTERTCEAARQNAAPSPSARPSARPSALVEHGPALRVPQPGPARPLRCRRRGLGPVAAGRHLLAAHQHARLHVAPPAGRLLAARPSRGKLGTLRAARHGLSHKHRGLAPRRVVVVMRRRRRRRQRLLLLEKAAERPEKRFHRARAPEDLVLLLRTLPGQNLCALDCSLRGRGQRMAVLSARLRSKASLAAVASRVFLRSVLPQRNRSATGKLDARMIPRRIKRCRRRGERRVQDSTCALQQSAFKIQLPFEIVACFQIRVTLDVPRAQCCPILFAGNKLRKNHIQNVIRTAIRG